MSETST
jgi:hypothetical protein